ncbi:Hypothetical predicted protein [Mytilus galloprovincialis]|uniref:IRG-type G domain-containing protein n=1 Tax=Mytilus galloprovincialis TaxID=29158 RepID=A0A8B6GEH6_MYTGA|nr:Hypothetical predicted protein [Mytilus galloprovincialis]
MDLKELILDVNSFLLESVLFYLFLLMLAVWLLQGTAVNGIKRILRNIHRRNNADDDDAIPNTEDYDLMSDSEEATNRNYATKAINPRLKYNNNPDEMMMILRNQMIKLAVTGRSCTGKSTFINLVRDVDDGEPKFAKTGLGDCNMKPTEYEHPRNSLITLTDLPAFGTDTVTKKMFLESIDLSVFDFVLIFFDSVIMEDDLWIAKQLQALGTSYCFVRSKNDLEILHAKDKCDMGKTEIEVVNEIRKTIEISNHRGLKGSRLFLISNIKKYFHIGDIGPLFSFIAGKLPKDKRDALLFFLPILSPEMIENKFKMLLERIKFISLRAAVVSAIPVPFLDTAINIYLVKQEIKYYIEIFLLDKEYVAKVPNVKKRHLSEKHLDAIVTSGLASTAKIGMAVILSQADSLIPVIGTAIAAKATSVYVSAFLSNALLEMKKDAIAVYAHYTKY